MPKFDPNSGNFKPQEIEQAYSAHDDLRVVGRTLDDDDALTLTAVMRNEIFYLPAFFEHYRKLGVERFVIVDDQSDDGSLEFLANQEDCMVLQSERAFNQHVNLSIPIQSRQKQCRMRNVWSNLLLRRYGMSRWSVHVDADEFLRIPEGMKIQDLLPALDDLEGHALWSLMIDLYPTSIEELRRQSGEQYLDPHASWYFDARQHSRFHKDGRLKFIYGGSRARLMDQFGVRKHHGIKSIRAKLKQMTYNLIKKPPLIKMPPNGFLYHTHRPDFSCIPGILLPLEHYKFSGQLLERTDAAIRRRSHYGHSQEYVDMQQLLDEMTQRKASFLTRRSSSDRSFKHYQKVKIAQGIDYLMPQ